MPPELLPTLVFQPLKFVVVKDRPFDRQPAAGVLQHAAHRRHHPVVTAQRLPQPLDRPVFTVPVRGLLRCRSLQKIDTAAALGFIPAVSTVVEIRAAIERLSPGERAELESLLWPDWDRAEGDTPPRVREKIAEALNGQFRPGDRSNIKNILSTLE